MPCHTRMKTTVSQGLLWFYLLEFGFMVMSLEPGYLDFDNLPDTNFSCEKKVIGGYYADLETSCQMFHVCTVGQHNEPMDIRFLCLNGTVFDQETRVCERIDEVDCTKSETFYDLNLELYGNVQPPILGDSLESKSSTTTTTTTTPKTIYYSTPRPSSTVNSKHVSLHRFPVDTSSDFRFNPEEINVKLNPSAPPDIRTKPVSFQQQSYVDEKNKRVLVTTHTTVYKGDGIGTIKSKIPSESGTTSHPTVVDYEFIYQPRTDVNVEYHTKVPEHTYYHNFPPTGGEHFYKRNLDLFSSLKSNYPSTSNLPVINLNHPTTFGDAFSSSKKLPTDLYQRTEKPYRVQLPLPILPAFTVSTPSPFINTHVDTKRYTDQHTQRIIVNAFASVSDQTGRKLNQSSFGTIADTGRKPPASYDDYKEEDIGLDPFYHDVPKVNNRRQKRSLQQNTTLLKNEEEAAEVLKFLINWYTSYEKTTKISIPLTSDAITEINNELGSRNATVNDTDFDHRQVFTNSNLYEYYDDDDDNRTLSLNLKNDVNDVTKNYGDRNVSDEFKGASSVAEYEYEYEYDDKEDDIAGDVNTRDKKALVDDEAFNREEIKNEEMGVITEGYRNVSPSTLNATTTEIGVDDSTVDGEEQKEFNRKSLVYSSDKESSLDDYNEKVTMNDGNKTKKAESVGIVDVGNEIPESIANSKFLAENVTTTENLQSETNEDMSKLKQKIKTIIDDYVDDNYEANGNFSTLNEENKKQNDSLLEYVDDNYEPLTYQEIKVSEEKKPIVKDIEYNNETHLNESNEENILTDMPTTEALQTNYSLETQNETHHNLISKINSNETDLNGTIKIVGLNGTNEDEYKNVTTAVMPFTENYDENDKIEGDKNVDDKHIDDNIDDEIVTTIKDTTTVTYPTQIATEDTPSSTQSLEEFNTILSTVNADVYDSMYQEITTNSILENSLASDYTISNVLTTDPSNEKASSVTDDHLKKMIKDIEATTRSIATTIILPSTDTELPITQTTTEDFLTTNNESPTFPTSTEKMTTIDVYETTVTTPKPSDMTTTKHTTTTQKRIYTRKPIRRTSYNHRFSLQDKRKYETKNPVQQKTLNTTEKQISKKTVNVNNKFNVGNNLNLLNKYKASSRKRKIVARKDEDVTAPALAKSANPTLPKDNKKFFSTTPLSRIVKITFRKERLKKNYVFNCFGKEMKQFYSDPRDCRLFHYCSPGYTNSQLLDMKFVCDSGTYFDDVKLTCTNQRPARCS